MELLDIRETYEVCATRDVNALPSPTGLLRIIMLYNHYKGTCIHDYLLYECC